MIDPADAAFSIARQCRLIELSRSTYYYELATATAQNLALMALIDKEYMARPFLGSRRLTTWLCRPGHRVKRKRVQRLMGLMGLEAVHPKPRLSQPTPGHRVYPYLLRNVTIDRPNHVWSTDITYIPMPTGFMYLTAVIDWHSRYVLSWQLSNTLEIDFCLDALDEALRDGRPEIFNTDQGSQYTAEAFVSRVQASGAKMSMDGRGRWLDNVFVERLWRSVKYEEVYIWRHETVSALRAGLARYFAYYNHNRPHQSLNDRTPAEVYRTKGKSRKGSSRECVFGGMAPVSDGEKRLLDRNDPGADAIGVPSARLSLSGLLASRARLRFTRHQCDNSSRSHRPVEPKTQVITTRETVAKEWLISVQRLGSTSHSRPLLV